MKLSRLQRISIAFFICSLIPAYLVAHWRYTDNLNRITAQLIREHQLHASTDKLLENCMRYERQENDRYNANYQICSQGAQAHDTTSRTLEALTHEKSSNETHWYRNFLIAVALFNLLGFIVYKMHLFLTREVE